MIVGPLAIVLNFISIALLGAFLCGFFISGIFFTIRTRIATFEPRIRRRLLWNIALAPWVVGVISSSIVLLSGTSLSLFPETLTILHWHHVGEFIFSSWHGLLLISSTFVILFSSGRHIVRTYHLSKKLNLLQHLGFSENNKIYQLDSNKIAAFTAGFFRPRCFVSRGLLKHLSDEERKVIIEHELAHAYRKDPLKKFLFQLLMVNLPKGLRLELVSAMTLVIEQCADNDVLNLINDRTLIASTLLKVNRLILNEKNDFSGTNNILCHYGLDHIELRILNLLNSNHFKSTFPQLFVLSAVFLTALFFGFTADLFHHAIELSLSH